MEMKQTMIGIISNVCGLFGWLVEIKGAGLVYKDRMVGGFGGSIQVSGGWIQNDLPNVLSGWTQISVGVGVLMDWIGLDWIEYSFSSCRPTDTPLYWPIHFINPSNVTIGTPSTLPNLNNGRHK